MVVIELPGLVIGVHQFLCSSITASGISANRNNALHSQHQVFIVLKCINTLQGRIIKIVYLHIVSGRTDRPSAHIVRAIAVVVQTVSQILLSVDFDLHDVCVVGAHIAAVFSTE